MHRRDPAAELARARQCFDDIVADLDLPQGMKTALKAAAESLAKARAVYALAEVIRTPRAAPGVNVGLN